MAHQFLFNPYILDNLPIPSTGFDVVQDSAEPRLRMYITNRGVKSFFIRKRVNGKDRRIIIGKYPDIEINYARTHVLDVLKSVSEKPKIHRKKISFRKIADTYLIKRVRRSQDSLAKLVRSIIKHLSPLFLKNIQDITSEDISDVLSKIEGCAVRNRMHELLRSIFKFAIENGYVSNNPVSEIPKIKEHRRVRPLTRAGFDRLLVAINKEKSQNLRAAFLMLIYGFVPKSKIFSMQWRDLNFNRYTWKGHPLSDAAVVLLQDMPQNGKWVFPGRAGRHLTDPRMAWKRVAMAAKIPNLTMDDVYKFLNKQLVWASDRESFRLNMNKLIDSIIM
ncbi:MAG: integrase family protein [Alphaproteobacteria bacterium]|nr:integrase family protein [Alphaproteobacteria bacterium]MBN2675129.1 integrase family protein [Alphaproteobacteria bacterium]